MLFCLWKVSIAVFGGSHFLGLQESRIYVYLQVTIKATKVSEHDGSTPTAMVKYCEAPYNSDCFFVSKHAHHVWNIVIWLVVTSCFGVISLRTSGHGFAHRHIS